MDKTAKVWDQRTYSSLATIMGHNDEVGKIKQKKELQVKYHHQQH
jgi:hypothetical protein